MVLNQQVVSCTLSSCTPLSQDLYMVTNLFTEFKNMKPEVSFSKTRTITIIQVKTQKQKSRVRNKTLKSPRHSTPLFNINCKSRPLFVQ